MSIVVAAALLIAVLGFPILGIWLARPTADTTPADLRRADEAEAQALPTAAEMRDKISEAWGSSRPLP